MPGLDIGFYLEMKVCLEMRNVPPRSQYLQLDLSLHVVLGPEGAPGEVGQQLRGDDHLIVLLPPPAPRTEHARRP